MKPLDDPVAASSRIAPPAREDVLALFSAVMLPMFLAAVDQTLLAAATPRIAAEFGRLGDTSWIVVGYLLAATVMAPVYGRLGDRLGRQRMLLGALGVFVLGSALCAIAPSMGALVAGRVVQGLGGGGLMVLSQALIGELVPPLHRARYQAYFAMVFSASSIGGPVIGGFVVQHASWRWLFAVNLPLGAFAAWRLRRLQPASRVVSPLRGTPLDPWGVLLFALTACSLLAWLSLAGHRFPWLSPQSLALLVVGAAGAALLMRQQRRHPSPFLPLDLLREPGVAWICGTVLCFAASMFALVFLLPIYLQLARGASAADAGLQLLPLTAGLVVGSTINSRITVRTAVPARTPPFGLGLAAAALAVLALAPPSGWTTNVAMALVGIGFGTVMPAAQLAVQVLAGGLRLGAAAALLSLMRSTGAAVGTAAFAGLAFALLGAAPAGEGVRPMLDAPPAQVSHAFHLAFGAVAVLIAFGAWIATRVPHVHLDRHGEQARDM